MGVVRDKMMDILSGQIVSELDDNNYETLNYVMAHLNDEDLLRCLSKENVRVIERLIEDEETVPITFFQIMNGPGWSSYCDVTGGNHYAINEGYSPSDREIFDVKRKHARQLGLI
jgi:hypothetical protein